MRRRGWPASFSCVGCTGAPFCSGGNFNTGSAIALFLPCIFFILNGVAEVFLDRLQLGEQPVCVRRADALKRGVGDLGTQPAQLGEQGASRLAQVKPVDAAVGLVAAALDP